MVWDSLDLHASSTDLLVAAYSENWPILGCGPVLIPRAASCRSEPRYRWQQSSISCHTKLAVATTVPTIHVTNPVRRMISSVANSMAQQERVALSLTEEGKDRTVRPGMRGTRPRED